MTFIWRSYSFGAFSAFIVALFTEMYGFPHVDLYSHESGHLWYTLLDLKGNPHSDPLHILNNLLILTGFIILYMAWKVLYAAQWEHKPATTGLYAHIRHPQYVGFITIMAGFWVAMTGGTLGCRQAMHSVSGKGCCIRWLPDPCGRAGRKPHARWRTVTAPGAAASTRWILPDGSRGMEQANNLWTYESRRR